MMDAPCISRGGRAKVNLECPGGWGWIPVACALLGQLHCNAHQIYQNKSSVNLTFLF